MSDAETRELIARLREWSRDLTLHTGSKNLADEAANALEAALAVSAGVGATVPGWQDISTAPKDRTVILGAWRVSRTIWVRQPVFWGDADGWVTEWDSSGRHPVSHWMPLPAPPAPVPSASLGGDDDQR